MPEGVLLTGILLGRFAGGFHLVDADRDTKGWIGFLPDLWISPVLGCFGPVDDRVEGRVKLPAVKNVLRFLVNLIADGVCIISSSRDQKVERLHSGIAGAFGHNIKELSVRLRVQFVKDHAVNVKAVL